MSYLADPAALFIELYDRLPEEPFLRSEPDEWEQDARVEAAGYAYLRAHLDVRRG